MTNRKRAQRTIYETREGQFAQIHEIAQRHDVSDSHMILAIVEEYLGNGCAADIAAQMKAEAKLRTHLPDIAADGGKAKARNGNVKLLLDMQKHAAKQGV
jgi:hypothetical protein